MWDKRIQAKGKARESSQKSQNQTQRILEYIQYTITHLNGYLRYNSIFDSKIKK